MSSKTKHVAEIILCIGILVAATGFCDIDWMINQYHNYDYSNVQVWYFSNKIVCDWWDAYAYSLIRLVVGSAMIGAYLEYRIMEKKVQ